MYDGEGGKERRVMKIGGSKTVFDGTEMQMLETTLSEGKGEKEEMQGMSSKTWPLL